MNVNWVQMKNVGVEQDMPITLHMKNAPVIEVLGMVMKKASENNELDPIGYDIQKAIVHISTQRNLLRNNQQIVVYDIGDIIERFTSCTTNQQAKLAIMDERFKEIKELVRTQVGKQHYWTEFGGDCALVSNFGNKLIVKAHESIQKDIKQLLFELRDNRSVGLVPIPVETPNKVDLKLRQTIKLDLHAVKLKDAMANLAQMIDVVIDMDWRQLTNVGVEPDLPITLTMNQIPAAEALSLILEHAEAYNTNDPLWYDTTSHNITVSTKRWLFRNNAIMVSYDVRNLLFILEQMPKNENLNKQQIHENCVNQIYDFIRKNIDPDMWSGQPMGTADIRELNGLLLIRAHKSMHRQIRQLLEAVAYQYPADIPTAAECKTKVNEVEK
ncbi:MAG TPA: hypothetical protein DCM28_03445 [Phycisphaerales bacterium]|nr:hypothetical protein [Phycisphaerales bacterium]